MYEVLVLVVGLLVAELVPGVELLEVHALEAAERVDVPAPQQLFQAVVVALGRDLPDQRPGGGGGGGREFE